MLISPNHNHFDHLPRCGKLTSQLKCKPHHPGKKNKVLSKNILPKEVNIDIWLSEDPSNFLKKQNACGKSFSLAVNLKKHVEDVHKGTFTLSTRVTNILNVDHVVNSLQGHNI